MTPRFSGLPFFVYPVNDLDRARAFYTDVLGLVECGNWENKWIEYTVGPAEGPALVITTVLTGADANAKSAVAAIETPDFEGTLAHLRAHGVNITFGPIDSGSCHLAQFEDSEGNQLIHHRLHPRKTS
jgi:predicted enzyme related to lactoylglutathione lyase